MFEEPPCNSVFNLPDNKKCSFILNAHSCQIAPIPVYRWLYCDFTGNLLPVGVLFTILTLIALFLILSSIADTCTCPCIETIASVLKMSDSLAGCTVLAFGNGAPDVLTALASRSAGLPEIFYTGLAGGCMFVSTMVAGLVLVIRPFRLDGWSIIRDILFLLISYFIMFACFSMGVISLQVCLTFVAIYSLYIATVVFSQWGTNRYITMKIRAEVSKQQYSKSAEPWKKRERIKPVAGESFVFSQYPIMREHRFSRMGAAGIDAVLAQEMLKEATRSGESIWTQFLNELQPFSKEEWEFMPWHERILMSLEIPATIFLKLSVPVCNLHEPGKGWSKLLIAINMILCVPTTLLFISEEIMQWSFETISGVPKIVLFTVPGIIGSVTVLFFTKVNRPPRGFPIAAFIGFGMALTMTNSICKLVVTLIQALGGRMGISYSTLGMTVLSWGNSLGDLVSNTTLAKNGMPRMGFAACFGAPLFTCIFGGGVTSMLSMLQAQTTSSKVSLGLTGGLVSFFLFTALLSELFTFILMDMDGRRSFGCFMVTLYLTFTTMVITVEIIEMF